MVVYKEPFLVEHQVPSGNSRYLNIIYVQIPGWHCCINTFCLNFHSFMILSGSLPVLAICSASKSYFSSWFAQYFNIKSFSIVYNFLSFATFSSCDFIRHVLGLEIRKYMGYMFWCQSSVPYMYKHMVVAAQINLKYYFSYIFRLRN